MACFFVVNKSSKSGFKQPRSTSSFHSVLTTLFSFFNFRTHFSIPFWLFHSPQYFLKQSCCEKQGTIMISYFFYSTPQSQNYPNISTLKCIKLSISLTSTGPISSSLCRLVNKSRKPLLSIRLKRQKSTVYNTFLLKQSMAHYFTHSLQAYSLFLDNAFHHSFPCISEHSFSICNFSTSSSISDTTEVPKFYSKAFRATLFYVLIEKFKFIDMWLRKDRFFPLFL